jgi:hypothetical protein
MYLYAKASSNISLLLFLADMARIGKKQKEQQYTKRIHTPAHPEHRTTMVDERAL